MVFFMNPSDYFRKAVIHLLEEKEMKQLFLAKKMKENPPTLNDFIKGRKNYSDKKKEKIATILGTTYVDMLQLGRELDEAERPQPRPAGKNYVPLPHKDIINQFQDKETARQINQMLVDIERTDPSKYKEVVDFIAWKHDQVKTVKKTCNGID